MKSFHSDQYIIIKKEFFLIFLLLCIVILFFSDVLFTGKMFFYRDVMLQFYPWHNFTYNSVQNFKMPFWNPYVYCGYPHFANLQSGVLYPLKIPFYLFSVEYGYKLFVVLHIFLAGLGTYILMRHWKCSHGACFFGAVVSAFNTCIITRVEFLSVLASYSWLPLIFYIYDKLLSERKIKYLIYLSVFLFFQLLAGNPQSVFYTCIFLFCYGIYKTIENYRILKNLTLSIYPVLYLFAAVLSGILLAAFQLLPFKEFVEFTVRSGGIKNFSLATQWSLAYKDLINFFTPFFWGNPGEGTYLRDTQFWITSFYTGIITVILSIFSFLPKAANRSRSIFFLGFLIFTAILALGSNTFLYKIFFYAVPGFNLVRYPAAIMFLSVFILSILGTFGINTSIEYLKENNNKLKFSFTLITMISLFILIALASAVFYQKDVLNFLKPYLFKNYLDVLAFIVSIDSLLRAFILVFLFLALFVLALRRVITSNKFLILTVLMVIIDFFTIRTSLIPRTDISNYKKSTQIIKYLNENNKDPYRIMISPQTSADLNKKYYFEKLRNGGILNEDYLKEAKALLFPNLNMYYGIYSAEGYDPMSILNYEKLLGTLKSQVSPSETKLIDLLNIKYVLSYEEIRSSKLQYLLSDGNVKLYLNNDCLPRAFTVEKIIYVNNEKYIYDQLKTFNPSREVLIYDKNNFTDELYGNFGKTIPKFIKCEPNEIILHVNADHECVLVLTDTYYPGWRVQVDGSERKCLKADFIFKGVYLRKGDKTVRFFYTPYSFITGSIITSFVLIILTVLLFFNKRIDGYLFLRRKQSLEKLQGITDTNKSLFKNFRLKSFWKRKHKEKPMDFNRKYPRSKKIFFVVLWAVFIMFLTTIPYQIASDYTPAGKKFMGFFSNVFDQNGYMAWIHQAKDGKVLFDQRYTTEKHSAALFHPLFYVIGTAARVLELDTIIIYRISRLILGFLLLLTIYYFCTLFFEDFGSRILCFILISLSSGLGWIFPADLLNKWSEVYHIMPSDLWIPESNTFLTILLFPLFSLSQIFILMTFIFIILAYKHKKVIYPVLSGISLLILGLVHPYDIVTMFFAMTIFVIFMIFINKIQLKLFIKYISIIMAISAVSIIYQLIVLKSNPVFAAWSSQLLTRSPNPYSYIIGFGLIGIFSVIGIYYFVKEKKIPEILLLSWLIAVILLIYSPLGFERRLIMGIHICLCILAVKAVNNFKFRGKKVLVLILILSGIPSHIKFITEHLQDVKKFNLNYTLFNEDINGFKWIEKNLSSEDAVLSSLCTGIYIPGRTGKKVYIGHYHHTMNFSSKLENVKKFYSDKTDDSFRLSLLKANNIKYVYYGEYEKFLGTFNPEYAPYLENVYSNAKVSIYRLK